MAKVTDTVAALAQPIVEGAGCTLWDVEYVKEAGQWFLRVYIDREGGVSIDDCEAVSRPLSEVSSAGADRVLKRPEHFDRYRGEEVEVRLYRPRSGRKEFVGRLLSYEDGGVTLEMDGAPVDFGKQEIALVRLYPRF